MSFDDTQGESSSSLPLFLQPSHLTVGIYITYALYLILPPTFGMFMKQLPYRPVKDQ